MNKEPREKNNHIGLITLIICCILTVGIIVGCLFFQDEFFGLFNK